MKFVYSQFIIAIKNFEKKLHCLINNNTPQLKERQLYILDTYISIIGIYYYNMYIYFEL